MSCSVLVISCDRYSDLWTPFFTLFRQHWPDCPFAVYLGSNFQHFKSADIQTIPCGEDRSWSENLRFFLRCIDSDYVLLLLEDFFLDGRVSSARVEESLQTLQRLDGTVLRLFPQPGPDSNVDGLKGIGRLDWQAAFRVSAQPAIWNRRSLLQLLRDGETAWDFEKNGTERSRLLPGFYAACKPVLKYRHVVELGDWFWSAARRYRKQNIGCDFETRPVMSPLVAIKKALNRRRKHLLEAFSPLRGIKPDSGRVAFLTNFIPPYRKPLLLALAKEFQGLRVFVSTAMEGNRNWKADWSGLDVRLQRTLSFPSSWKAFGNEKLAIHFPIDTLQQLWRFKPGVVISAEMGFRTLGAVLYRKLHPRSKLVVWADISEWTERRRGTARSFLRRLLRDNVDLFLVNGRSGATYLQNIGVGQDRICEVPSTVDVQHFGTAAATRFGSSAHRLLYVGQLIERKGLREFLMVLNRWAETHPERKLEWLLAGDGPLRSELENTPTAANLIVTFLGSILYEEMPSVYADAGILVLPTLADAWGMTVNEGMAAGLPVLGSIYSQAIEELVDDGKSGWTFRPDRSEEMLIALNRCLESSETDLNEMRAHARDKAVKLTPELVAKLIVTAMGGHVHLSWQEHVGSKTGPKTKQPVDAVLL